MCVPRSSSFNEEIQGQHCGLESVIYFLTAFHKLVWARDFWTHHRSLRLQFSNGKWVDWVSQHRSVDSVQKPESRVLQSVAYSVQSRFTQWDLRLPPNQLFHRRLEWETPSSFLGWECTWRWGGDWWRCILGTKWRVENGCIEEKTRYLSALRTQYHQERLSAFSKHIEGRRLAIVW